ncbi:type ISP restriction/modification enzyme [Candidatus Parabeggiatoa sp. HSG14]|uniref:type ISP restriction/modification enzyme n=1 Tax=Candidatus Parabeggiatoa sp. HSG14 TaxID=3055593 RepID=UPI0025A7F1F4|nr:N-6 DNA methylase [Thiotrichales bacterium HSG14]
MFSITQKNVQAYYKELKEFKSLGQTHEGTVKIAFQHLLESIAKQHKWTLTQENTLKRGKKNIRLDGVLFDSGKLLRGYWEAKDSKDDLVKEVQKKLYKDNYPDSNIIFQEPNRAIVYQNGREVIDLSLTEPDNLVKVLDKFFNFQRPEYERWDLAAVEFKSRVPELAENVLTLIQSARVDDKKFAKAFNGFADQCRQAINPNLADAAIEEMLIQHLLTERIFRNIFKHPDFAKRNIIAREIENVIDKLTAKSFNRDAFFDELKYFYKALEDVAATIDEYGYKQHFLNTVYERFFQGFSVKVADTHGIVYTPQPIVDFMVKSVNEILDKEFGKSLTSKGVHFLDPFVGTGNFMVRLMREIASKGRMALSYKYKNELHCNEVMLLPYYIASMNIEHEFLDLMGKYQPFEGICLADTFELAEDKQVEMFAPENTERVKKQQGTEFFVIIGNPPYNVGQINENDNNKNHKYPVIDGRVKGTYAKDSKATNKNALADPYVKAIRWASDRIGEEGIVAFVTNNGFLDGVAFDGMRKHLEQDFSKLYILDLGGNVRKNPKLSGTTHNVFGIQVGVSINLLVKKKNTKDSGIFYARVGEDWRKESKYNYLDEKQEFNQVEWQIIAPDKKHTWLTKGLHSEFDEFLPLGTKETKAAKTEVEGVFFKTYGGGVNTARDAWTYNFNQETLVANMQHTIDVYNTQVKKWIKRENKDTEVDDFVLYDDSQISWARNLKRHLKGVHFVDFSNDKIRNSLYRPFIKSYLFFDRIMNNDVYPSTITFPNTENENSVICVSGVSSNKPFHTIITDMIPCFDLLEKTQCFPFYTYNEDGTNRQENVTNWTLNHFQQHYQDNTITKWAIFHYVYGLLHHPDYREKYAANLKRELPRLPMTPDFWAFSKSGEKLAELHLNYEDATPYPLKAIENPKVPFSLNVEKMRLSKDKKQLKYNDFLTLDGIPKQAFEYKLGNRSALDWVIDQYRIKVDKRSGIINDPNRQNDEEYILELVKKVITISLETIKVIEALPVWKTK